jgi:hypothetical protein
VWEYLKIGIPSMGSLWLETVAYEVHISFKPKILFLEKEFVKVC